MRVLNLSTGFKPFDSSLEEIESKSFLFSGGEVHIKLQDAAEEVLVSARLNDSNEVMKLLLAVDALRRNGSKTISAFIPYLPYARQDRVMVGGEPLSIKVMCNLINSCNFEKVYVFDVHSEVSLALLDNCELISNYSLAKQVLSNHTDYLLVSPDAGALKKIYKLAEALAYHNDIILCNKVRDVSNGKIKQITVDQDDLGGKDCFIIDDICDGGATFVGVAKELKKRNAGKVSLIVSHGIMSHGEAELVDWVDHIYTTDSIKNDSSDLISRILLADLIEL
ncbi:ribose-phosphate pyrophosphokinase [Pedobacter steynii]|uniref:Ribose-phosphate pyrophosphokinase n=1 Tax=Pedobacter steynii TaxID=430522 RepID=A0A1H0AY63_9SPHI|nr:ribose-phosphate diphosphokinase [Pedobacter steynii]NQX41222.1 ribose-phosphate pyrophosphokinase [Pedobacter steynii]SDN38338.1 ribose-phosphate pyrophosphokinase [Pedobacter steynii]